MGRLRRGVVTYVMFGTPLAAVVASAWGMGTGLALVAFLTGVYWVWLRAQRSRLRKTDERLTLRESYSALWTAERGAVGLCMLQLFSTVLLLQGAVLVVRDPMGAALLGVTGILGFTALTLLARRRRAAVA